MTVSKVLLSKGNKLDWQTPPDLFERLNSEFHFALDACTSEDNPLHTPLFYTEKENGLYKPWFNTTYVNPPYGREHIEPWLMKAKLEATNGVTSVFLLPSRTGTSWWHSFIYNNPNVEYRFLKGRLKFQGSGNSAPFDSVIVIFQGCKK